jgi:hypothetical protein
MTITPSAHFGKKRYNFINNIEKFSKIIDKVTFYSFFPNLLEVHCNILILVEGYKRWPIQVLFSFWREPSLKGIWRWGATRTTIVVWFWFLFPHYFEDFFAKALRMSVLRLHFELKSNSTISIPFNFQAPGRRGHAWSDFIELGWACSALAYAVSDDVWMKHK